MSASSLGSPPARITPNRSGRRRWIGAVALGGLCLAVAATGCNKAEDKKDAKAIQLVVVYPGDLEQFNKQFTPDRGKDDDSYYCTDYPVVDYQDFTGRLDAYRTVDIKARVSGFIVNVPFKEGDIVTKDQLLFEIDPRTYQADYNQAEADLKVAITDAELQQKNAERATRLVQTRGMSQEDYETAIATKNKADATVGLKKAARDKAALYLGYCTVTAPVTGRISRRFVDPGNLINADTTMLTEIVTINPVYAYFDVDERTYLELQRRKTPKVYMRLANEEKFTHTGDVDFVDNKVNPNAGTIRMRGIYDYVEGQSTVIAVAGPAVAFAPRVQEKLPAVLTPGLFCRVRVPVGDKYTAVLIPDRALQTDQGRKFVYVVTPKYETLKDDKGKTVVENGKEKLKLDASGNPIPVLKKKKNEKGEEVEEPVYQAEYREVETGQQLGEYRVIKKGLSGTKSEWIVTLGQQRVRLNAQGEKQEVEPKMDETTYPRPPSPVGSR
jgi:RND family efflux transporter MFP subunit